MSIPFPPSPWTLRGVALHTVQFVPLQVARRMVPSSMRIVPVLPGFTVGGLYIARYGPNSTLEYSELIVVPAIVWHSGRAGIWISNIFVDNEVSIAGGRDIWALDKERAEFQWRDEGVTVTRSGNPLCSATVPQASGGLPLAARLLAFGTSVPPPPFSASVRSRIRLCRADWEISRESPFGFLAAEGRRFTVLHDHLLATVYPPRRTNK